MLKCEPMQNKKIKTIIFDFNETLISGEGDKIVVYPHILDLLKNLKEQGKTLYLWTLRGRTSTLQIMKEQMLLSYFTDVYCGTDIFPKPSIQGLMTIIPSWEPSEMLMIGDGFHDMQGAKNIGCKCIGVLWNGLGGEKILQDLGANFLAHTPLDCLQHIKVLEESHV